ncbi:MAG TPA: amidohydrolase family protein [Steroidobacteraceae bacterium]|nr:amidohydrolase family protein [Steroidobacteraceae bacterium]
MEAIDTLITARWVVPIEPAHRVLDDHAVAVHRGRIVAILPSAQARTRFSAAETIERPAHVLLPGLVNAHTRAAMSLLRGAVESSSFDYWLNRQVRPLEQRWMDADYVRDGTELAIADMLTSGTTCFADMHLFPEVVAQAASAAKIRACIGLPVADTPGPWAGSANECLAKGIAVHDEYRDDPLITTAMAPDLDASADETLVRVRRGADELELPVTIRLVEARDLGSLGRKQLLGRLEQLGLLSPLLTAVHVPELDDTEVAQLSRVGASVVHCSRAGLKLGLSECPVATLKANSVNVALGTDAAACSNDLSMLAELQSAALTARGLTPTPSPIPAHEWLHAATLGGARALGLAEVIGSLVPGKWADLCCIDLARAHTQPVYDPAAQLLFSASRDQVSDVWVAGRQLVQEGRLLHLDLEDVLRRAQYWHARIQESLHTS